MKRVLPRKVSWSVLLISFLLGCASNPTTKKAPATHSHVLPYSRMQESKILCRPQQSDAPSRCRVSGTGDKILIRGIILDPHETLIGGEVLISAGRIIAVGCDVSPHDEDYITIDCPRAVVSPGFINLHDHISYDQNYPGDWGIERFAHRHEWRKGLNGHTQLIAPASAEETEVAWSELRQLMAGTTSIVGSGGSHGFLRNLDRVELMEGITGESVHSTTFPLGDAGGTMLTEGCGYPKIDDEGIPRHHIYIPHVSEGIDKSARNEFLCISTDSDGGHNLLTSNTVLVHTVGILAPDAKLIASRHAAIVWSPRSNLSLYGDTASVTLFKQLGINIALSSDWTPSGSMHILRELKCAMSFNRAYLGGAFSSRELWAMATSRAADAIRMSDQIGRLKRSLVADIAVFKADDQNDPYSAVIASESQDVLLVLRGGMPMYGDVNLIQALVPNTDDCEVLPDLVCGVEKAACIRREIGINFFALQEANRKSYLLYSCGTPPGEPPCVPARHGDYSGEITTDDLDGDGIPNNTDNCPTIFNPVRPLDSGLQADWDGDGLGDACDPTPLQ